MTDPPDDFFEHDPRAPDEPGEPYVNGVHHGATNGVWHEGDFDSDAERPPSFWEPLVISAPRAWYETNPPRRAWLLRDARRPKADGLLPLGKVGQLIAEGGAGKTMGAFQLAIAVATCSQWLGAFDVAIPGGDGKPRKGRVLFIPAEEDAEECHRRLHKARRATGAPIPEDGRIVVLPLAGVMCPMLERDEHRNIVTAPFLTWLRGYLDAHGPWDLIIVDPLSRFAGPDAEIDNAAATQFIQSLESIATLTGATVLVCHHTNKLARRGGSVEAVAGRGSSALVDGVRWQCSLGSERIKLEDPDAQERLGELVVWTHTKTNYSRRAEELLLRRDLDNGGALVPVDETDLETVQAARGRDPGGEVRKQAKVVERDAKEASEDAAVFAALGAKSPLPTRQLVTAVQALAHCCKERAEVAIARVADQLTIADGPRHGPHPTKLYSLTAESP